MIPPAFDESDLPDRLRRLLAAEIDRVLEDLSTRRELLMEAWSRHRDRSPFIDTLFSRWTTLSMTDLALVDSAAMSACEAFYRELDDFRLYVRFTQDMPTTMEERYDLAVAHLSAYGALAIERLGGVPEKPWVQFDEEDQVDVPRLEVIDESTEE